MKKPLIIITIALLIFIMMFSGGYYAWNNTDPEKTCAQCHEVTPAHISWMNSAHASVKCTECHGTALSDGMKSLKEKAGMFFTHLNKDKRHSDIFITEKQRLDIADRCAECHRAEHAGWLESGHAANYRDIFMDKTHNVSEKPYADCFRCHGMFYDGDINSLMSLEGDNPEKWHIKDKAQEDIPTITCLSCHQIHTPNPVARKWINTDTALVARVPVTSFYMRAEKMYMRTDKLIPVDMVIGDSIVTSAKDASTLLCQQCHAPDYRHEVLSMDDKTPTGEHAGKSCLTCHSAHSMRTEIMPAVHKR